MLDAVILFLNHDDNPTCRHHLELIRTLNPYPVIPIHTEPANPLPASLDVGTDPQFECERGTAEMAWRFCDNPLYQWYRQHGGGSKRYIFIEADTLTTMPLREFYGDLWDADAAGSIFAHAEWIPGWHWLQPGVYNLPASLDAFAAGILPMCGLIFSDAALRTVSHSSAMPSSVVSELRLGTLLRYHGIDVRQFQADRQAMVRRDPTDSTATPGVWHPVKA